eukprot:508593_1
MGCCSTQPNAVEIANVDIPVIPKIHQNVVYAGEVDPQQTKQNLNKIYNDFLEDDNLQQMTRNLGGNKLLKATIWIAMELSKHNKRIRNAYKFANERHSIEEVYESKDVQSKLQNYLQDKRNKLLFEQYSTNEEEASPAVTTFYEPIRIQITGMYAFYSGLYRTVPNVVFTNHNQTIEYVNVSDIYYKMKYIRKIERIWPSGRPIVWTLSIREAQYGELKAMDKILSNDKHTMHEDKKSIDAHAMTNEELRTEYFRHQEHNDVLFALGVKSSPHKHPTEYYLKEESQDEEQSQQCVNDSSSVDFQQQDGTQVDDSDSRRDVEKHWYIISRFEIEAYRERTMDPMSDLSSEDYTHVEGSVKWTAMQPVHSIKLRESTFNYVEHLGQVIFASEEVEESTRIVQVLLWIYYMIHIILHEEQHFKRNIEFNPYHNDTPKKYGGDGGFLFEQIAFKGALRNYRGLLWINNKHYGADIQSFHDNPIPFLKFESACKTMCALIHWVAANDTNKLKNLQMDLNESNIAYVPYNQRKDILTGFQTTYPEQADDINTYKEYSVTRRRTFFPDETRYTEW